jgi:hypothetical protein
MAIKTQGELRATLDMIQARLEGATDRSPIDEQGWSTIVRHLNAAARYAAECEQVAWAKLTEKKEE